MYLRWLLHHEQYDRQDESRIRDVAERFSEPARKIHLQRLRNHVVHVVFPTKNSEEELRL